MFQPDGEQRLLHLTAERLVGGEEEVLGQLLAEGRGAARDMAGAQTFERHRAEADEVDAEMLVEALVFDGDESFGNIGR